MNETNNATRPPRRCGIVFVATGVRYVACAEAAARSVYQHMPDIPIALFTDAGRLGIPLSDLFDPVIQLDAAHRRSKVDCLMNAPFERTLFLDADIRLLEDVRELFDLLDRFDIAMAHAHARNRAATRAAWTLALPDAFPQFNTGVIAVRRTPQTRALLQAWSDSYTSAGFRKDQVTLRELLWQSDLRITTLPPEYNIRYPKYLWLWGRTEARPRICHFNRYSFVTRRAWLAHLGRRMAGWPRRVVAGMIRRCHLGDTP